MYLHVVQKKELIDYGTQECFTENVALGEQKKLGQKRVVLLAQNAAPET
jgi:hypothetical protein